MAVKLVIHSHRGGTGKSTIVANLAVLLAAEGRRVGLVDMDLQSPTLDVLFGLPHGECSLTDYLLGNCEIEAAAHQVAPGTYVVPARTSASSLAQIMTSGYDVGLLPEAFDRLIDHFDLDVLLLDTHAGLNNETVTAMASADALVIMIRTDLIDLSGAEETVAFTERLGCRRALVVSMAPVGVDHDVLRDRAERVYGARIAGTLPYVARMAALGSERIFSEVYPDHSLVTEFRKIVTAVL